MNEELKNKIIDNYSSEDLMALLDISTEELLDYIWPIIEEKIEIIMEDLDIYE